MQTLELAATYTSPFKKVIIKFYSDEEVRIDALGELTEEQFDAFVKAGGGDVEGWTLESLV